MLGSGGWRIIRRRLDILAWLVILGLCYIGYVANLGFMVFLELEKKLIVLF